MLKTSRGHVVRALTIAGSDSGGGAGIQADLKTMHQFQVYGMSVLTAVTAQNTQGVQGIFGVDPDFVRLQLESIVADLGADAVKTGMLGTRETIAEVARFLKKHPLPNLVVDPVMVAKGGAPLLAEDAVDALVHELLPLAKVVTPNLPEAEVLYGSPIRSWDECRQAAVDIARKGPEVVVIKGGHTPAEWAVPDDFPPGVHAQSAIDLVYCNGTFTYFATPRVHSKNTHGTGCTYSAATASMLARGATALQAIAVAKEFVFSAVARAMDWDVGHGHGPTDHSAPVPAVLEHIKPGVFYMFSDGQWKAMTSTENA
jgi:hydroxymethylpyrimidine/phosphomethylpyrimidine kinase